MPEETRMQLFHTLKSHLKKLVPPMVEHESTERHHYELTGNKPVPYGHDKKIIPGMYFASIAHRKDSVAFYFFPAYFGHDFQNIAPGIMKCLKGKTCFHFKKPEQLNESELEKMLQKGLQLWRAEGYMTEEGIS